VCFSHSISFLSSVSPEILFLSGNNLQGSIPSSLGVSTLLRGLYLSANQLAGSIPTAVCSLTNLEALFLDENSLQGSIPDCIGNNVTQLKQLYLFSNQLTGPVPYSFRQLTRIDGLGLEDNLLNGTVSSSVCTALKGAQVWADCGGSSNSSSELTCPCCTVCCPQAGKCQ
jgi:Leucine-rich repeat (LRR) protein